jgi:hypothetical protein
MTNCITVVNRGYCSCEHTAKEHYRGSCTKCCCDCYESMSDIVGDDSILRDYTYYQYELNSTQLEANLFNVTSCYYYEIYDNNSYESKPVPKLKKNQRLNILDMFVSEW